MSRARTDPEAMEMAALREREAAHIDSVDPATRQELGEAIRSEVIERYPVETVEAVYAAGSWARGEAIPHISDIDVRVVVDRDVAREYIEDARDYFKLEWSPENCPSPFGFVDLWLAPKPPDSGFILVAEPGREGGR